MLNSGLVENLYLAERAYLFFLRSYLNITRRQFRYTFYCCKYSRKSLSLGIVAIFAVVHAFLYHENYFVKGVFFSLV